MPSLGRAASPVRVRTGLDSVIEAKGEPLKGKRVGLLVHAASLTFDGRHAVDALTTSGVKIVKLFGAEHGFRGLAAAGENEGRIQRLAEKAADQLAACEHTPRLLAACARVFLAAGAPEKAHSVVSAMPEDSALRHALEPGIRFALNIKEAAAAH